MNCKICKDQKWVCEFHSDIAWDEGDGCCGGAGMICICHPHYEKQEKYKNEILEKLKNERA